MLNKIKERGRKILNGRKKVNGQIGKIESSVIDYVVTNEKAIEDVKKIEEGNKTESDHISLKVELKGMERRNRKKSDRMKIERSVWTKKGIEYYHGRCESHAHRQKMGRYGEK